MADASAIRETLLRQAQHWSQAVERLSQLDALASREAWSRLERYLGLSIRDHLRAVLTRLRERGTALVNLIYSARTASELAEARRRLLSFRREYLRAEITIDFYSDAINSRANALIGARLRACDILAQKSMSAILDPLGHQTPIALTYIDKGLGASILKAGLRLWDGGNPSVAAAIKLVHHNIERPTSLIHEAGHQVAHITAWNAELAAAMRAAISPPAVADLWASWASEISADGVAFVHTGFGSVLALHDVLADEPAQVFAIVPGDPHPSSYLRVLLGVAMCRVAWGAGEWDAFGDTWDALYPLHLAPAHTRPVLEAARAHLETVARLTIATPMRAFRGRRLIDLVPVERVSPIALTALEQRLGAALYTSSHWIWTEALRLLALTSLGTHRTSLKTERTTDDWMLRLGGVAAAA
jgi:hypothetical protein